MGECKCYHRSNTRLETYVAVVSQFKKRLRERKYPVELIEKVTSRIKFSNRQFLLNKPRKAHYQPQKPTFKCLPMPKLCHLKTVILRDYRSLAHITAKPRFVTLAYPSLKKLLVRAEVKPTAEQLLDLLLHIQDLPHNNVHITQGQLPQLRNLFLPCVHPTTSYTLSRAPTARTSTLE